MALNRVLELARRFPGGETILFSQQGMSLKAARAVNLSSCSVRRETSIGATIEDPQSPLDDGFLFTQMIEISEVKLSETDDLAAVCLSPEVPESQNVRFHALDSVGETPHAGTRIMFTGFPAALSQNMAGSGRAAFRSIGYQTVLQQEAFGDFDPERHFASDYTFGRLPVEPMGFSGAAAWFDIGADALVWTVKLGFAGVLTSYHRKKRIVEGVRVDVVRDFLGSIR